MLTEIRCNQFRDSVITFHTGLNVVLGDENATNSIGKSTLLMIIDFVFGGDSFLKFNTDVVQELGHHEYNFCFEFDQKRFYFKRKTDSPNVVSQCTQEYGETNQLSVSDFTSFLKSMYSIESEDLSFREFVGLFSRVWGKENHEVKKPLHAVPSKSPSLCVDALVKMFNAYAAIKALTQQLALKNQEKTTYSKAFAKNLIPKINKTKFKENERNIEKLREEISDIKANLAKFAMNISEIANKEVMDLKVQKDELLRAKLQVDEKLVRVRKNLSENRHIKSKHLQSLQEFFPDVNLQRLATVEEFHSQIATILRQELLAAEKELISQSEMLNGEIAVLDQKLGTILSAIENPSVIVDRIYNLSDSLHGAEQENKYYKDEAEVKQAVKDIKEDLHQQKYDVLRSIENKVNGELRAIIDKVYGQARKSPTLTLTDNNYTYHVFEDTGTGTAYSNLLVFDLAIFRTTKLPVVVHDSFLFKNIENIAVANLVKIYRSFAKQSFIAIDEIKKYGKEGSEALEQYSVTRLSNEKVLYIKDWRK